MYMSIVGSVVECSPATRAARVRFPDDASYFSFAHCLFFTWFFHCPFFHHMVSEKICGANLIWLLSLCVLSAKSVQFRRISRSISSYMLKFHTTDPGNFKLFVFSSINKSNFMKYSGNTSQNTQSTVWKRRISNPRRDSNPQSPA